ncbi:TRAP transporter substrate-binding protein [Pseudochelatococcus sp. B33]
MKIMSFFQRAGVAAIAAAFLLSPGMTVPASAQTKLRLAVETTPGDPLNVMLATFRDELQKTAGGEVDIEFFEGGALGDENALTDMVRVNRVQVLPMGSDIVQLDNTFSVFDVPFLFTDKAAARKALDGELGDLLRRSLRDKAKLEVLAFGELGFRVISNNVRPINAPADLSGLKIRTPGSEMRIRVFRMLGAAPTPMALGDAYVALRQGALDGQENPLSVIEEFSLHEVQKFISLTNHIYSPISLLMNGQAWDALGDELKQKVLDAAKVAAQRTRELSDTKDAELVAYFEKAGVAVNEVDVANFREASGPIREEIGRIVTPEVLAQAESAAQ